MTDNITCSICRKPKANLRPRKSDLLYSMMLVCEDCFVNKREPRAAIILVAKQNGIAAVQDYIVNRRYVGNAILAEDLV